MSFFPIPCTFRFVIFCPKHQWLLIVLLIFVSSVYYFSWLCFELKLEKISLHYFLGLSLDKLKWVVCIIFWVNPVLHPGEPPEHDFIVVNGTYYHLKNTIALALRSPLCLDKYAEGQITKPVNSVIPFSSWFSLVIICLSGFSLSIFQSSNAITFWIFVHFCHVKFVELFEYADPFYYGCLVFSHYFSKYMSPFGSPCPYFSKADVLSLIFISKILNSFIAFIVLFKPQNLGWIF